MDGIGAEVGHKMRSAIKAKLLELSCYVDDELPDYIMVMVANKRTKSQMNEDLNLFLSTKTSTFVDWLHIVLKKLKEVTVTNTDLYKRATKRKTIDVPDVKCKKEKKDLILDKGKKEKNPDEEMEENKSIVDSLPNRLSEQRKITVVNESSTNNNVDVFDIPLLSQVDNISSEEDLQNIERKIRSVKSRLGLMVDSDLEEELPEMKVEKDEYRNNQQKLNNRIVKIHNDDDDQSSNKREEINEPETEIISRTVSANNVRLEAKPERKRIIFEEESPSKKVSVLKRLGNRPADSLTKKSGRTRISLSEFRKEEEPFLKYFSDNKNEERARDRRKRDDRMSERSKRENNTRRYSPEERKRDRSRERHRDRSSDRRSSTKKEGILSRLGVMSKVSVPPREPDEPELENELKTRAVRSMVQVKPRVIPSGTSQPNKNLLLKAVAEAQRSIAQAPYVGKMKAKSLNADIVRESEKNVEEALTHVRKFSQKEKNKLKNLLLSHATQDKIGDDGDTKTEEYIPKPIKETPKETPKYIPSSRMPEEAEDDQNQQFIVTLDVIERKSTNSESRPSIKDRLDGKVPAPLKPSVKSRLDSKKSPSPIIFDKVSTKVTTKVDVPDRLPIVHPPLSLKNKERCKYWPNCRQGDKCEFVHPVGHCEKFPHCKFGDKCLFIHPTCKFGSSCTKRDCPYNHITAVKLVSRPVPKASIGHVPSGLQLCKFFPGCANSSCQFYHPKPCKYGKFCKNPSECNFSHHFISNKSSLIWRSK